MRDCSFCKEKNRCMERSRCIPCASFQKEGEKNESDRYDRHPKKSNPDS